MKTPFFLAFIFLLAACAHKPPTSDSLTERISPDLAVQVLDDSTFVVTDTTFYDSNVLIAKMPDKTVVIASSPFETVATQAMLDWIKIRLKPKKIVAVNTHFHADGTGGNEAYQKAGVEVWASRLTAKLHKERAAAMQEEIAEWYKTQPEIKQRILNRKTVFAENLFDPKKGLEWSFAGEEVVVFYPGPAHSEDNVVVFLPKRGVLFGGCMIRTGTAKSLGNTGSAHLDRWDQSAKAVLRLSPKTVIPGHGPIGGIELIEHTIQLVESTLTSPKKATY